MERHLLRYSASQGALLVSPWNDEASARPCDTSPEVSGMKVKDLNLVPVQRRSSPYLPHFILEKISGSAKNQRATNNTCRPFGVRARILADREIAPPGPPPTGR